MRGLKMDGWIIMGLVALLVVLAVPVLLIVLFVKFGNLRSRVEQLETRIRDLKTALDQQATQFEPQAVRMTQTVVAQASDANPQDQLIADGPKSIGQTFAQTSDEQNETAPIGVAIPIELSEPDTKTAPFKSPWPTLVTSELIEPRQNSTQVSSPNRIDGLFVWAKNNWVYVISAISLALAGIFFVQYGMEKGLLPPAVRILCGLLFGAGLIVAGEWVRRRYGDEGETSTVHLPSVFSGAGLVSMFAAILAARQMYGLIGPELTFAGLLATAAIALVLGWFYGPLLIGVGLIGATAAPFIVGGNTAPGPWLYGYFALILSIGLGVDAMRRWVWVSVLSLGLGYGAAFVMMSAGAGVAGWIAFLVLAPIVTVILPRLAMIPTHPGPAILQSLVKSDTRVAPNIPTMLAFGAALASSALLALQSSGSATDAMLAAGALTLLALAFLLWADRAEGLADLALLPGLGLLSLVAASGLQQSEVVRGFAAQAIALRPPETAAPMTVSWLLLTATVISAAAAWRASRLAESLRIGFGLASVLLAPLVAVTFELLWNPSVVLGVYPWALNIIALACGATGLALHFAKLDRDDLRLTAYATLSALSLIALALFLLTTKSALTLSLAVLALVAAALDRRFKLPEMGYFIQLAVAVIGYRLLADPGLSWALQAPLGVVLLAFVGVIGLLIAAHWQLAPLERVMPKGVLESAIAGLSAILVNILIQRWLMPEGSTAFPKSHWSATLNAMPWLVLMLMQVYRAALGGPLRPLRYAIAAIAGLFAASGILLALVPFNPLFTYWAEDHSGLVRGPLILDSLAMAYVMPAVILLLAVWKLPSQLGKLRIPFVGVGVGLMTVYAGLEIRRIWQGDWLGVPGVVQGELYTYTVALMVLGAGLLYMAILRRSLLLRRVAMAVIGLTIAKVFFIDVAGLTGLTRVFSFLGLGLSLAGLAWLNRWAGEVSVK